MNKIRLILVTALQKYKLYKETGLEFTLPPETYIFLKTSVFKLTAVCQYKKTNKYNLSKLDISYYPDVVNTHVILFFKQALL